MRNNQDDKLHNIVVTATVCLAVIAVIVVTILTSLISRDNKSFKVDDSEKNAILALEDSTSVGGDLLAPENPIESINLTGDISSDVSSDISFYNPSGTQQTENKIVTDRTPISKLDDYKDVTRTILETFYSISNMTTTEEKARGILGITNKMKSKETSAEFINEISEMLFEQSWSVVYTAENTNNANSEDKPSIKYIVVLEPEIKLYNIYTIIFEISGNQIINFTVY